MRKILGLLLLCGVAVSTSVKADDLYQQNLTQWKQQVQEITGREYKFLVAADKVNADASTACKQIWDQVKAVAEPLKITMTEKKKEPFVASASVKTYYDTANLALWNKGYLIRVSASDKAGKPVKVSVKSINGTFDKVLAAPLKAKGVKSKVNIEDNIGIGKDGKLVSYLDKAVNFSVMPAELGAMNLENFATYVPELLELGLPDDTKLVAHAAYDMRCRPGHIELPGLADSVEISMEGWSRTEGGKPFVYDFSFGYNGDFTKQVEAHKSGEQLMKTLQTKLGGNLAMEDVHKWIGSKVRVFLNQPI